MTLAMNREVFITCAVTGSGDTTGKSDKVPVTPAQIADSAIEAARAGAAVGLDAEAAAVGAIVGRVWGQDFTGGLPLRLHPAELRLCQCHAHGQIERRPFCYNSFR